MRPSVSIDVERPPTFQRAHVFLRVGLLIVLGWVAHPFGLLWLGLPIVAAILVSQKGGQRYLNDDGPTVARVLGWVLGITAYIALLTDALPTRGEQAVRLNVQRSGTPSVASALLRILYAIPSLIAFAILSFFGTIAWFVAMVSVLVNERYPESIWRFLAALLRWEAFLLAYLASLTDEYPPFALSTAGAGAPVAASRD